MLPTYHEGMPMSVLEAMAYGMAVVSTYVGGIPHIITSGENGLLCEAGDKETLKEKLMQLLSNSGLRKMLGSSAKETLLQNFDIKETVGRLLRLYENV